MVYIAFPVNRNIAQKKVENLPKEGFINKYIYIVGKKCNTTPVVIGAIQKETDEQLSTIPTADVRLHEILTFAAMGILRILCKV